MSERYKAIYAIGDVHGCATELQLLLRKLPLDRGTLVVFLGDYVDRGSQSRQVIETILELKKKVPVVALKGNHEAMLLDFLDHPESAGAGLFIMNGGSATLVSYETEPGRFAIPPEHEAFFRGLRLSHETEEYFFVHAGLPDVPLESLDERKHGDQMLWIRSSFLASGFDWKKKIVHGHTPVAEVEFKRNRVNVDTGCVYNGRLTAIELPGENLYSVEKRDKSEAAVFLRDHSHASRVAMRFKGALRVIIDKGIHTREFETLNYNQFGLLIREPAAGSPLGPSLQVGEAVTGVIGTRAWAEMSFVGVVVRTETRGDDTLYGVKVTSLSAP